MGAQSGYNTIATFDYHELRVALRALGFPVSRPEFVHLTQRAAPTITAHPRYCLGVSGSRERWCRQGLLLDPFLAKPVFSGCTPTVVHPEWCAGVPEWCAPMSGALSTNWASRPVAPRVVCSAQWCDPEWCAPISYQESLTFPSRNRGEKGWSPQLCHTPTSFTCSRPPQKNPFSCPTHY